MQKLSDLTKTLVEYALSIGTLIGDQIEWRDLEVVSRKYFLSDSAE